MRTLRSLVTLALLTAVASAGVVGAAWVRHYSGPSQNRYNQAADSYVDTLTGNLYVVGSGELAANPGGTDLLVAKYRPDGTLVWVSGFSGTGLSFEDMAHAVAVDSIGNVYIAGMADNSAPAFYDAAWAKYDSNGVEIWHRTSTWGGDDVAYDITIGTAGDVYVCGADSGNGWLTGYMVARINPASGDTLWKRSYILDTLALKRSGRGRDLHPDYFSDYDLWDNVAAAIAPSPDGGVVTAGHGSDADRYFEWWTMKFNAAGTRLWATPYHHPNTVYDDDDVAFDLAVARNGDIYVAGFDYFETDANYEGYNLAVARFSSAGARLNWRSMNVGAEDGDDAALSLCLDDSATQNVYATGFLAYPSPLNEQVATYKFNSTLNPRWGGSGTTLGATADDRGYSVCYRAGRVYVTGMLGMDLAALGYTAANGSPKDTLWTYVYSSPDQLEDYGATVCVADSDHIYVSGQSGRTGTPFWYSLYTGRLRYAHPDMAVSSIVAPQGQYSHYDSVIPEAVIVNRGDVIAGFNAFMYIGLSYGDTVAVSPGPAPGESVTVTFRPWLAHPTGLVPVRCSLETDGDVNPSNDFLTDTVTVLVVDVGCSQIVAPVGTIDSGRLVTPQARVRNYGAGNATFPVWFRIHQSAGSPRPAGNRKTLAQSQFTSAPAGGRKRSAASSLAQVYEDSVWLSLNPGESTDVSFSQWTATPPDTYNLEAFTDLYGDVNVHNDTALGAVIVRRPRRDVGVQTIVAPPDTVDSGTLVRPRAVVRNYGTTQETFRVRFTVGTFFLSETSMTLASGASDTARFASWTAIQVGTHTARCTSMLAGDENPLNDLEQKQVVVLPGQGIESPENVSGLPVQYALDDPAPNPFAGGVTIRYALPRASQASLCVYNSMGVLVRALAGGATPAGFHRTTWNGTDERGRRVRLGTYFLRFEASDFVRVAKIIRSD